jgi:hypothetical protein
MMYALLDCLQDETYLVKLCSRCGWLWAFCVHDEEPLDTFGSVAVNMMLSKIMQEVD